MRTILNGAEDDPQSAKSDQHHRIDGPILSAAL